MADEIRINVEELEEKIVLFETNVEQIGRTEKDILRIWQHPLNG
jgi:hypothetical protein